MPVIWMRCSRASIHGRSGEPLFSYYIILAHCTRLVYSCGLAPAVNDHRDYSRPSCDHIHMRLSTIVIALFVCAIAPVHAQQSAPAAPAPHTWYFASGGEWILSYALLDVKGDDKGSIPRFSPFFNLQRVANYDVNEHFGFFVGLSLRNVGFIYDVPDTTLRYKFRTYTLGLPIGFKVVSGTS